MGTIDIGVKLLEQISTEVVELEKNSDWYSFYREQQLPRLKDDLKILLDLIDKKSRVLEIGSNPPFFLSTVKQMDFDVTGIDLHPESFSKTVEKFDLKIVKVNIEAEKIPFDDNYFDYIIFTEVFEHLRINPVFTVSEIHRVLKSEGVLLLETPNLYSLKGIYNFLFKGKAYACSTGSIYDEFKLIEKTGFFGHIREYTFQELSLFLRQIGFDRIKIIYRGGGKFILTQPLYRLAPFLRPSMMILATK